MAEVTTWLKSRPLCEYVELTHQGDHEMTFLFKSLFPWFGEALHGFTFSVYSLTHG